MRLSTPLVLASLFASSSAFSIGSSRSTSQVQTSTTQLHVGMAIDWNPEEDEAFLMQKAQACANSDSCSLEDAKTYLDDVIHIQSGCASGVLLGSDVCDNVGDAAGIVADLRAKIDRGTKQAIAVNSGSGISISMVLLAVFVAGMVNVNPDVAPFTPQEWWWAIRDGYVPLMIEHYFKHGGLSTIGYDPETTPFALQEWWWAIKGGYLNTMADHFFRNGGLATSAGFQPETSPLTPQEWLWALQDGYLPKMIAQNFQSGGLPTSDLGSDVLPFTPQEWLWAVKGNYAGDMVDSYFRNGGL